PKTLLKNNGFDSFEGIEKWKLLQHEDSTKFHTFDLHEFPMKFMNPIDVGIIDSLRVKIQQLHLSIETLSVLMNLDCIIKAENLNPEKNFDLSSEEREWKYEK